MRRRLILAVMIATLPGQALAQQVTLSLDGSTLTGQSLFLIAAVTLLGLAPGLAVMITCFPFIVTVLSILRQAIGLQQSPPNMLIVTLALFLTWFVMEPVFLQAWTDAVSPLMEGRIDAATAFDAGIAPFRIFMAHRLDPETLAQLGALRPQMTAFSNAEDAPLSLLVPSFMLSEMSRAFEIGFLIYLPFLIIDLVVSAVLMSMGMMMVPPAVVALPFKLAFFVVANGWALLSGALVRSYF
ncbi:flagellar type III secretion system pore protein FliP [Defluviimonas sp. WL0002]|uniref:Flagellar biosynthetic protein FliP n=1 Tax=Albidovulum marisflavi TaxID=2984159 RepID=A0ABT2Z7L3_9RHOB|nr:flagellar type III secretion system pore protein FliP [Defluviimonas sp. WL0002]MCV2867096.1 flagellar type III secretion system pore protein FliP [Defluviimonas sp. WL0002]